MKNLRKTIDILLIFEYTKRVIDSVYTIINLLAQVAKPGLLVFCHYSVYPLEK